MLIQQEFSYMYRKFCAINLGSYFMFVPTYLVTNVAVNTTKSLSRLETPHSHVSASEDYCHMECDAMQIGV
jgi:hypothetical protein